MNPRWAYGPIAWIVHQAAKLTPELVSHRLAEEWSADLSVLEGTTQKLRFALGCCLAALTMRGDRFDGIAFKTEHHSFGELPVTAPRRRWKFPFANRRNRRSEEAFAWLERLRRGLRDDEGTALKEWLRPRSHRICIARAAANRISGEDVAVLGAFFEISPEWIGPTRGRSVTINTTAVLMAIGIASLPLLYAHYSDPGLILGPALEGSFMEARGDVYTSGQHTVRRIGLPDGTQVVMNRATRIAALYSGKAGSVLLLRGEVMLTVPRQTTGYFDLIVGDRMFSTSASSFNVRVTRAETIELTVIDGIVAEAVRPAPAASQDGLRQENLRTPAPFLLKAHQTIEIGPGSEARRTLSQLEMQARTAWQRG